MMGDIPFLPVSVIQAVLTHFLQMEHYKLSGLPTGRNFRKSPPAFLYQLPTPLSMLQKSLSPQSPAPGKVAFMLQSLWMEMLPYPEPGNPRGKLTCS